MRYELYLEELNSEEELFTLDSSLAPRCGELISHSRYDEIEAKQVTDIYKILQVIYNFRDDNLLYPSNLICVSLKVEKINI